MKKTFFRLLSVILVLAMATACFASCSEAEKLNRLDGNEKALTF